MPQEGQDWFVQYLLSQTHSVVRASLLSSGAASSCQDWVLKMVSANDQMLHFSPYDLFMERAQTESYMRFVRDIYFSIIESRMGKLFLR